MNAVVQQLFMIPEFRVGFLASRLPEPAGDGESPGSTTFRLSTGSNDAAAEAVHPSPGAPARPLELDLDTVEGQANGACDGSGDTPTLAYRSRGRQTIEFVDSEGTPPAGPATAPRTPPPLHPPAGLDTSAASLTLETEDTPDKRPEQSPEQSQAKEEEQREANRQV